MSFRFIGDYVFASLVIDNEVRIFRGKNIDEIFNKIKELF